MTEVANSDVSRKDRDESRIEENDPLFELSQIMGLGEGSNAQSREEIDPQIDLEDALMAEISGGEEPYSPVQEQSSRSLEDELSAMLSGKPYVREPAVEREELDAPEAQVEEELFIDEASFDEEVGDAYEPSAQVEPFIPEDKKPEFDAAPRYEPAFEIDELPDDFFSADQHGYETAAQPEPEVVDDSRLDLDDEPSYEGPSFSRATPVAAFGGENAPLEEAINEISDLEETFSSQANLDLDDASLDDDFSALFEDELNGAEASDDVNQGNDAERYDPFAELPEQAKERPINAPILETTDMSAFARAGFNEINVPNLPEYEAEALRSFDDELAAEIEGDVQRGAYQEPVVANVAADDVNTLDDFDDGFFEAELARDMEFVSHDLNNPFDGDDEAFDDQDYIGEETKRAPVRRGLVIGAALGICAILGVVGVFALGGSQTTGSDAPVLIKADSEPTKVAPDDPGGTQVPNQDLAVFEEGALATAPSQEALVTSSEEPVDITSVPEAGLPSTFNSDVAQKGEDRLTVDDIDSATSDTRQAQGIAPRKVKTLIVKPDGTLVEREIEQAPEPTIAVSTPAPAEAQEVASAEPAAAAPADATTSADAAQADPVAAPNEVAALPTRTVTTKVITPETIASRPKEQPVNVVQSEAPAVPQAPAPQAPVASTAVSGFAVQLASLPTQADAQVSADSLSRRYADLIGGRGVNIQKADIAGKGTYYRVRVGATSKADAVSLCERLKAAGGSCFVSR